MSNSRTRIRTMQPETVFVGRETASFNSSYEKLFIRSSNFNTLRWKEKCVDEVHAFPFKVTGPFNLVLSQNPWFDKYGSVDVKSTSGLRYVGGFLPGTMGSSNLSNSALQLLDQTGPYTTDYGNPYPYGASAWNRFKPKTTGLELGTFIRELRDLPQMLKTTAEGFKNLFLLEFGSSIGRKVSAVKDIFMPKRASDHWLNTQFGWLPFVNDLYKMHDAYNKVDPRLRQLIRDNGKWTKRGGQYSLTDTIELVQEWNTHQVFPNLVSQYYRNSVPAAGHSLLQRREYQRVWFEGSFKYWVPEYKSRPNSSYEEVMQKTRYYGLRISPKFLWDAMPWSWLIDWGTNAGDVIDNLGAYAQDNLAARYACIMCHKKTQNILTTTVNFISGDWNGQWSQEVETKRRQAAMPFGFVPTDTELSDRQRSILLALGITRL